MLEPKVFQPSCATGGCHDSQSHAGQLDLSPGHAWAQLVGVPAENVGAKEDGLLRVQAGDPDHSLLVLKVRDHVPVAYGTRMPQSGNPLTGDEIDAIAEWVRQGAKND